MGMEHEWEPGTTWSRWGGGASGQAVQLPPYAIAALRLAWYSLTRPMRREYDVFISSTKAWC